MAFSITFLDEAIRDNEAEKARYGQIVIGTFHERFFAPLHYWAASDYEHHWKESLTRITGSGSVSCLITSMYDPEKPNFIFWWPMYRIEDQVFIQNHILFLNELLEPFNESDPCQSVRERRTVDEDGNRISEWSVSIDDIASFLSRIGPINHI